MIGMTTTTSAVQTTETLLQTAVAFAATMGYDLKPSENPCDGSGYALTRKGVNWGTWTVSRLDVEALGALVVAEGATPATWDAWEF